jgi:replicative DNA helicase
MLIKPAVVQYLADLPHRRQTTEFPTGIEKLDHKVWFSKQNLNIIAGRPSNNKSSFILNSLAVPTVESGKRVILFTLEDRKNRYVERYLACKTGIVNYKIQHNNLTSEETDLLYEHREKMKELPFDIIEDVGYKIEEIEKYLKECILKPDMIIIDYLNKIQTKGNRLETINDYLRRFSMLTKEHNFCGIICCQINREAMGEGNTGNINPPMLHHIKESGDIEQIADVAMLLHWKYKYTDSPEDKNSIQIFVAKNKDGESGIVKCHIAPEFNRITNEAESVMDAFQKTKVQERKDIFG